MSISSAVKAYIAATIYALIIGFSFIFVKVCLPLADPLTVLAHRFTASLIGALIPLALGRVKLSITARDFLPILPIAVLYPVLFFLFQVLGLKSVSASEGGIIQATIPIFTMILASVLIKEKTTLLQKLSLLLSVGGVIYLFAMKGLGGQQNSAGGIALMLLSTLSHASYGVLARKVTRRYRPMDLTYMMVAIGFISFNAVALVSHMARGTALSFFAPLKNPAYIGSILYLGVLSSLVTAMLSNYAFSKIDASKMSVFNNLSTLVTVLAGVVILKETLYAYHWIGTAVILLGLVGVIFFGRKKPGGQPGGR